MGCDLHAFKNSNHDTDFNPRTRMGCDHAYVQHGIGEGRFQSTHPHGVRRGLCPFKRCVNPISIHAPAWGATNIIATAIGVSKISIHAPAWGATFPLALHGVFYFYFNPRTRMGCDFYALILGALSAHFNPRTRMGCDPLCSPYLPNVKISIHAPAWGATRGAYEDGGMGIFQSTHPHGVRPACLATRPRSPKHFNPRTRMGCDLLATPEYCRAYGFQSTHPHGVRLRREEKQSRFSYFNPRTRMGCDVLTICFDPAANISIHAPAWGATH